MKKLVSMLLALCLVLGVTAASAAVPAEEIKPPMAVCCVSWLSRWLKNMVSAL